MDVLLGESDDSGSYVGANGKKLSSVTRRFFAFCVWVKRVENDEVLAKFTGMNRFLINSASDDGVSSRH